MSCHSSVSHPTYQPKLMGTVHLVEALLKTPVFFFLEIKSLNFKRDVTQQHLVEGWISASRTITLNEK